jgi:hypothetical protein
MGRVKSAKPRFVVLATSLALVACATAGSSTRAMAPAPQVRGARGALGAKASTSKPYVLSAEGRVVETTARPAAWFGPLRSSVPLRSGVHASLVTREFPADQFDSVVTRVGYVDGGEIVFKAELSDEQVHLTPGTRVTARIVLGDERTDVVTSAWSLGESSPTSYPMPSTPLAVAP